MGDNLSTDRLTLALLVLVELALIVLAIGDSELWGAVIALGGVIVVVSGPSPHGKNEPAS